MGGDFGGPRQAASPVLAGEANPIEPGGGHLAVEAVGEGDLLPIEILEELGIDLIAGEGPRLQLNLPLLGGEQYVEHGDSSHSAEPPRSQ